MLLAVRVMTLHPLHFHVHHNHDVSVDAQDETISIANTNGRPIVVTETRTLLRFTMVRNESDYDPKRARKFMDTINVNILP